MAAGWAAYPKDMGNGRERSSSRREAGRPGWAAGGVMAAGGRGNGRVIGHLALAVLLSED